MKMIDFILLNSYLKDFFKILNLDPNLTESIIVADGDKCQLYKKIWKDCRIPYKHGVAMYLITKFQPYCNEVRETKNGWVYPDSWVVNNYYRFKSKLDELDK